MSYKMKQTLNLSNSIDLTSEQLDFILSPQAIRARALKMMDLTIQNKTHFSYNPFKLKPTVEYVLQVMNKNYPDLNIPFHSRWVHFKAGGVDRSQQLNQKLSDFYSQKDPLEIVRAQLDLVITSVLLDAGAGAEWSYVEEDSGQSYTRSEGLGVASYHLFCSGVLSSDKRSANYLLRADSEGLKAVTSEDIKKYFQVTEKNPLVGIEGRVQLLNNLGQVLENKTIFKDGRPGNILDYLIEKKGSKFSAPDLLRAVLDGFGAIWPGRLTSGRTNLGDVWMHSLLGEKGTFESLVPIHKLSQWMTYSLIEPIYNAGFNIQDVDALTGLAEYRNGGLMLDLGLLTLKNPEDVEKIWTPDSELIIEWRSLTLMLLDQIGMEVQKALGKTPQDFPLAKVLEGGTWWAGRFIAKEKRSGGGPPLNIQSDGTVF